MDEEIKSAAAKMPQQNKIPIRYIIAAVVLVAAAALGIGIYCNTPENRLARLLDLGHKYLEEGQYEEAAVSFEEAIGIDPRCMEAYAGGVDAYVKAGDGSCAANLYEKALEAARSLEAELLERDLDDVVKIYLLAESVYDNGPESLIKVLEEGFGMTSGNPEIKNLLVDTYISAVEEKAGSKDYEGGLTYFDRLLELDAESEKVIDSLERVLGEYLDVLLEKGDYDKIRDLAEKYGNIAVGIDFDAYMRRPYAEEHNLIFGQPGEVELPYRFEFIKDMDTFEITELEGAWIERGQEQFAINEISAHPSEQDGCIDVIVSSTSIVSPDIYGTYESFAGDWLWGIQFHDVNIGDYYTGLIVQDHFMFGDGTLEEQKDFEWNGDSYSIKYVKNNDINFDESGWQYGDDGIFHETVYHTVVENLIITVPKEYDGLVLRLSKSEPEWKWSEDMTDEEEYLWDADNGEGYIYYRVSDLLQ